MSYAGGVAEATLAERHTERNAKDRAARDDHMHTCKRAPARSPPHKPRAPKKAERALVALARATQAHPRSNESKPSPGSKARPRPPRK